jgi:hypothetical protein
MDASWIRDLCLSFPAVTEHVIWGSDLTFKVAGKIFAHTVLEPAQAWLSFKASAENFYELTERPGIIPPPISLARNGWLWKPKTRFLQRNCPCCARLLRHHRYQAPQKDPRLTVDAAPNQVPACQAT